MLTVEYQLFFETNVDNSLADIQAIVSKYLVCYTIVQAIGVWCNTVNPSFILTAILDESYHDTMVSIAQELKAKYNQEAMLLTVKPVKSFLL